MQSGGTDAARLAAMHAVADLAEAHTVAALIERTLTFLEQQLGSSLVSFNRMNPVDRTATVSFRPYRPGLEQTVDGVAKLMDEHPLYRWYMSQPDWSAMRISDVMPWKQFRTTRLLTEVLEPAGASHTIVLVVAQPRPTEWVYFAANRATPDFSDADLELCRWMQPGLVALYTSLAAAGGDAGPAAPALTRREQVVLGYLAGGFTAEAIARQLSVRPATVRKHLQNLYAKLGTSDRLGAVIRGRELGLLHADDVSREFSWNVRYDNPSSARLD